MNPIRQFFRIYVILLLICLLQKPVFLLLESVLLSQSADHLFADMALTVWHGLSLDLAIAAYLSVIPGLLLLCSVYVRGAVVRPLLNGWLAIAAFIVATCTTLNLALYPYWGFPLDSTPFYYFFTSPADALASTSLWVVVAAVLVDVLLSVGLWLLLRVDGKEVGVQHRGRVALAMLLLTALLFLPIRGGVTVSTNNSGRAYFSQRAFLNHAAVNPVFSLMESLLHTHDFRSQYRFMDDAAATAQLRLLTSSNDHGTQPLIRDDLFCKGRPDILLIVMEGFASDLMSSLHGTHPDVAPQLDSLAREGVLFTQFYANSFRTDRGLLSILSGYPAQPTMSLMRYTEKAAHLPSLARSLTQARGYETAYFYGGDVDFAGQRAYLISQGFRRIVSDTDFPVAERLSKWGVPDHIVAQRVLDDIRKGGGSTLRVLQTSSSHEPFDVPYHRLRDERLNAFAYTDSVVGRLVGDLKKLPQWRDMLIVIVPDHVGGYKETLDNLSPTRYQIPLILAGGAVARRQRVDTIGSQTDIAATLLGQLGIAHADFTFSKNLMSAAVPHFAFFTVPDAFGMVTTDNTLIYDNKARRTVYDRGNRRGANLRGGQAYLQKLYDDIDQR